jgi:thymidine phosphorylase
MTDMNQPLASAAGNALEMANAVAFLTGDAIDPRLWEVTVALGGELLMLGGLTATAEGGRARIAQAFRSGKAAEVFARMVAALGGPADFLERPAHHLPAAPVVREVAPAAPGLVQEIDTRAVGIAVIELGGGRRRAADRIDYAVGFTDLAGIGTAVDANAPLARIHARTEDAADAAAEALRAAYTTGAQACTETAVILDRIA